MTDDQEIFECGIYDLFNRHGFMEGDALIAEEKPLVEAACHYLANALEVIEQRWQPIIAISSQHYVKFEDTKTQEITDYYSMSEKDRRKVNAIVDKKNLSWIKVTQNLECYTRLNNDCYTKDVKMTDEELKVLVASLAINQQKMAEETNRAIQETQKEIKELKTQIGAIANKFGSFTEGLALPSMTKILTKQFGMTTINPSVRVRDKHGNEQEIDVLAYANGTLNTAFIVEVKSHLREEGIEQLIKQCRAFPALFPELADKKLYGILAAVDANQHLQAQVLKKGLYFAKIHDDQFSLCVPDDFQPFCFNNR
jgi:hypothetical protein